MLDEAVEFIQEYQEGKYGYAVRGDAKSLMYYMATKCKTDKELHNMQYGFMECLKGVGEYRDDKDKPRLENAWVSQEGDLYYCIFGHHLFLAEHCFLTKEGEFEKTHAKVRFDSMTYSDATKYMTEKPSNNMKSAMSLMGLKRR